MLTMWMAYSEDNRCRRKPVQVPALRTKVVLASIKSTDTGTQTTQIMD